MPDIDLDDLASELADFAPAAKKQATYTPREERIIAGFEDIERFFEEHGRLPQHGEERDIFERLYAVRLDRLRAIEECRTLLEGFDKHGLLDREASDAPEIDDLAPDDLASELAGLGEGDDITQLRHVRSSEEKRAAEDIARRDKCADFEKFEPVFKQVKADLADGTRVTRPFELKAEIRPGAFFIVFGQICYVAEMGEVFTNPQGRTDARLRVIFDNGTESGMLMRSLQRQLNEDEAGRRITEPEAGPLFTGEPEEGDEASGTIYVLRSRSDYPLVAQNRELVHKIGVTNLKVEQRIAGARLQPTFLLADVEVVATYELFNINRTRLEKLIHRFFADVALDIEIPDRFGNLVRPREWFMVPLHVIDEAVTLIRAGTVMNYAYDRTSASIVTRDEVI